MSDFLALLAARETGQYHPVLPRLASRYEPADPGQRLDIASEPETFEEVPEAALPEAAAAPRPKRRPAPAVARADDAQDELTEAVPASPVRRQRSVTLAAQAQPTGPQAAAHDPVRTEARKAAPPVPPVSVVPAPQPQPRGSEPRRTVAPPPAALPQPAPVRARPAVSVAAPVAPAPIVARAVPERHAAPARLERQLAPVPVAQPDPAPQRAVRPAQPATPEPLRARPPLPGRDASVLAPRTVTVSIAAPAAPPPQAAAAPTIHVTIGRVEVRAVAAPAAAPRAAAKPAGLTLEQFLAQQGQRGER